MPTFNRLSNIQVDGTVESSKQGKLIGSWKSMPEASQDLEGITVLYVGPTTEQYTQFGMYTCVEKEGAYVWESAVIPDAPLESGKALVSDAEGKVAVSAVTDTELGYVAGVTSGIQGQIDADKQALTSAVSDLTSKISANTASISSNADNIDSVSGRVKTIEDKVPTIESGISANGLAITALQGRADTAESDITALQSGKVDKVDGKGLSEADFTTLEKTKLNGIAENAQVNVIEEIQVNGVKVDPTSPGKAVDVKVPTKTSEITNDSKYVTTDGAVFTGAVEVPDINLVSDAGTQKAMPAIQVFKYINETDDEIQAIQTALEGKQPKGEYATIAQLDETNATLADVQTTANRADGKADANALVIIEKADKTALAETDGKLATAEEDITQLKTDVQTAQTTAESGVSKADAVDAKVTALAPTVSISGQTLTVGINGKEASTTIPGIKVFKSDKAVSTPVDVNVNTKEITGEFNLNVAFSNTSEISSSKAYGIIVKDFSVKLKGSGEYNGMRYFAVLSGNNSKITGMWGEEWNPSSQATEGTLKIPAGNLVIYEIG